MATYQDVQFHYDVDNEFFELFLDKKYRVYSCGVWQKAATLEEAQKNKLRRLADFAHISEGASVLDIGCGWGGMLEYCTQVRKVKSALGLTMSRAQYDYIRESIQQKNSDNIEVNLCSWAELKTSHRFDAIVSIGAMEHFASVEDRKNGKHRDVYRHFFKRCYEMSAENTWLGLQTIITLNPPNTLQDMRDTHYLLKHVFPGSALPELEELCSSMHKLYEPADVRKIGRDYVLTLKEWKKRLNRHEEVVIEKYGQAFLSHYNHYFDAAIRSFENETVSLLQMSLKKIV